MMNWKDVRPLKKWALIKSDPRVKQTKGGISLPDQMLAAERVMEGTGRVLRVGGQVSETIGFPLAVNDRIVFRGFLKDASSMEFYVHEDGCAVFMIRAEDILAVVDDGVSMGAFQ